MSDKNYRSVLKLDSLCITLKKINYTVPYTVSLDIMLFNG